MTLIAIRLALDWALWHHEFHKCAVVSNHCHCLTRVLEIVPPFGIGSNNSEYFLIACAPVPLCFSKLLSVESNRVPSVLKQLADHISPPPERKTRTLMLQTTLSSASRVSLSAAAPSPSAPATKPSTPTLLLPVSCATATAWSGSSAVSSWHPTLPPLPLAPPVKGQSERSRTFAVCSSYKAFHTNALTAGIIRTATAWSGSSRVSSWNPTLPPLPPALPATLTPVLAWALAPPTSWFLTGAWDSFKKQASLTSRISRSWLQWSWILRLRLSLARSVSSILLANIKLTLIKCRLSPPLKDRLKKEYR